ncbi:MAG: BglII/BstYI family type II restriction endonuclease [Gemmatimonadaceae bacterium]
MRIVARHSHQNGWEFIKVHQPKLWTEIEGIVKGVDATTCKTKVSKEARTKGKVLYSPIEMNKCMVTGFAARGWKEHRTNYWVTEDAQLIERTLKLPAAEQKKQIEAAGKRAILSYNQTDFVKSRVAVEVQFGKYAFVAYDLFVKHMAFYIGNVIDVGVEILPMKSLQAEMASGVGYYEAELYNLVREGRGVPAVPLVLIGVAP